MGESLTERYRVRDDGLWVVNLFFQGGSSDVYLKNKQANSVPAAAVRRRMQVLSGIIGRKASVGCLTSLLLKVKA